MSKIVFNYEQETYLDKQLLKHDRLKMKAYICSPLGADNSATMLENMHCARAYMLYASKKLNVIARAPHAYLPLLLCDKIHAERALALEFGVKLLEQSDILLVCGVRVSSGMRNEIIKAAALHMDIIVFEENVFLEVKKLVTKNGGNKSLVTFDRNHPVLALPNPIFDKGGDGLWSDFIKELTCAHAMP